jgi:hypothetical protein
MRATGYTLFEVADEIFKKVRPLRKDSEDRDRKIYARYMAQYAFGVPGGIYLTAFQPTPEKILSFQQEAEKLETARLAAEREKEAGRQIPLFQM